MDAAFEGLRQNMPRAPEELVERMVRTVNALEKERARRAGKDSPEKKMQVKREAAREMTARQPKPPGMG